MLQLSERLQQNITFVLRSSRELEEQAASSALSQPGKLTMLCYDASELALTALISSDEVESLFLPREEQLLQREAASALRQIALHALDIQAWELPDAIRAELAAIRKHCETLANCVVLPPEPEAPAPASLVPVGQKAPAQAEAQNLMLFTPTTEEDEETRLRAQIRALRELLATLVQERDELVHVICRELEARYYRELGSLEAKVFRADGLGGKSAVAFETLYEGDVEVAVHADLDDADQTVLLKQPPKGHIPPGPGTGDPAAAAAWAAAAALAGAVLLALQAKRKGFFRKKG